MCCIAQCSTQTGMCTCGRWFVLIIWCGFSHSDPAIPLHGTSIYIISPDTLMKARMCRHMPILARSKPPSPSARNHIQSHIHTPQLQEPYIYSRTSHSIVMFALFVDADVCSDSDEFAVDTKQGPRVRYCCMRSPVCLCMCARVLIGGWHSLAACVLHYHCTANVVREKQWIIYSVRNAHCATKFTGVFRRK